MVPLVTNLPERVAAAIVLPIIAGAAVYALAAVANWYLSRPDAQLVRRTKRHKPDTSNESTALDPSNQRKVDLLSVAVAEIRNSSNSQDLEEMETYVERRRQVAALLAYKNGWY